MRFPIPVGCFLLACLIAGSAAAQTPAEAPLLSPKNDPFREEGKRVEDALKDLVKGEPFFEELASRRIADWKAGAEKGSPQAQYLYARCLAMGCAAVKNEAEALRWFRRAAEAGEPKSLRCVGKFYLEGIGVAKDANRAIDYFTRAAELGDAGAMCGLGSMYLKGTEVPKDLVPNNFPV